VPAIYYQNVHGLRTKISQVFFNSSNSSYDVFALTETSLNSSILDSELFFSSFQLFRRDRHKYTDILTVGGGVLIAVKNSLACKLLEVPNPEIWKLLLFKLKLTAIMFT
jgi:hypothetical protein